MEYSEEKLLELIKQGESQDLEFKQDFDGYKTALKTVSAFANTNDGLIIFGVSDDGKVVECDISDKQIRKLTDAFDQTIKPKPQIYLKKLVINGTELFIVRVERFSGTGLVLYSGVAYKRVYSQTIPMTTEEVQNFYEVGQFTKVNQPVTATSLSRNVHAELVCRNCRTYVGLQIGSDKCSNCHKKL